MADFGRATSIEPEAIGEPGQRTFRLRVLNEQQAASLWLEKEQLAALAMAIRELFEQASVKVEDEPPPRPTGGFPDQPDVEFKIGRLGLGYDETNKLVVLLIHAVDEDEEAEPSFSCRATFQQCSAFAGQAEEVVAGGRPTCIACGLPINPDGHECGRRNGHERIPISLA
jgi:uncharacterized repeat protein (TIGR03847 family)